MPTELFRSLSTCFLLVLTFCEQLLTFFQEESQAKRDERKDHGALDESSSEQQVCESVDYTLIVRKNWSPRPSATGSYRREGGSETKYGLIFKVLKFELFNVLLE